ncbi:hypothetical protein FOZ61_008293 [Perkinsus olseni]|uniref:Uncharacterized protein n=1 Tax=Perkinsus olseni TaxID=32597 RepID=A0A7J6M786_PEROL|nr:hypothetical protein FOZ61_008293 [Perkinsus olseni]
MKGRRNDGRKTKHCGSKTGLTAVRQCRRVRPKKRMTVPDQGEEVLFTFSMNPSDYDWLCFYFASLATDCVNQLLKT